MSRTARMGFLAFCFFLQGAIAAAPPEVLSLRAQLELPAAKAWSRGRAAAESLRLPVSRPFSQEGSQLCWVYATVNAIESDYLARHPGETLELSRVALQYATWEDRYLRKIWRNEDYLWERGTEVDAIDLIRAHGLVQEADYRRAPVDFSQPGPFQLSGATPEALTRSLYATLDAKLGALPAITHFHGVAVPPAALAEAVLHGETWEAYAPALDGREGYATHWDPDARPGTQALYLSKSKFFALIHRSLKDRYALALSICGHDILLYGADYDANGNALAYYVKDNYDNPFYAIDPARIVLGQNFCGVSRVKE